MGRNRGQSQVDTHWAEWTRSEENGRKCDPGFRDVEIGAGVGWVGGESREKGGAPRVTDEAEARARAAELGPFPSTGPDPGAAGAGIAPPAGPSRL